MILQTRWIDRQLPDSIKSVFVELGEKFEFSPGETIIDKNEKTDGFYYVCRGLLAVSLCDCCDRSKCVIVKFVPKSRMFGFSDFFFGRHRNYGLTALRQSVIYKISYDAMESLMRKGIISKRLFCFYGKRALETKYATQASMAFVPEADIASVVAAGLSMVKDWDEYGRYRKIVDLTQNELCELKYLTGDFGRFKRSGSHVPKTALRPRVYN